TQNQTICYHHREDANPYEENPDLKPYWENLGKNNAQWKFPDGLFWICGKRAYITLPSDWKGVCTIGVIQPAFFLLPQEKGNKFLGRPL
ncbi:ENR1 protein, partial [Crypturellus undulatus]|nr:ENR1 protein [Crypturellus undulatus]